MKSINLTEFCNTMYRMWLENVLSGQSRYER